MKGKKGLILLTAAISVLVLFVCVGSIITIGDKLNHISALLEYGFYGLSLIIFLWFIVRPFYKIVNAPPFPSFEVIDDKVENYKPLKLIAENLIKYGNLPADHKANLSFALTRGSALNDLLKETLENRSDYMNKLIKDTAVLVFVSTAVSQNGKLDAMASLIFNLRLIKRLVYATGFRPSYAQLINLYRNVIMAALVAATVEDLVEEFDVFTSALPIGDKLLGFIAKSAADGAANALLTLRVGFITKEYLLKTPARFNAIEARKVARKQALMQIPWVCTEGLKNIGQNYVKVMRGVF